jgi:hypothetical protein
LEVSVSIENGQLKKEAEEKDDPRFCHKTKNPARKQTLTEDI